MAPTRARARAKGPLFVESPGFSPRPEPSGDVKECSHGPPLAFLKRPDIAHHAIDGDSITFFVEPLDLDAGSAGFHRDRFFSNTRTGRFPIVFSLGGCCPKLWLPMRLIV